jgi:putative nucleotidyltransferase-like protein
MTRLSDTCILDEQPATSSSHAEIELLLCCARTRMDSRTLDRLRSLLHDDLNWPRVIQTASRHGVLPLLYRNLHQSASDAVPKVILNQLRDGFQSNVQHSLFLTAELFRLLDVFALHGINVIPFKGAVLAASVYGDLSLRPFSDVDLLLNQDDLLRAGRLLASLGYENTGSDLASDDNADPEEVAYSEPKFYIFVHKVHRTRVDLQWRIAQRYFSFSLEKNQGRERLIPVMVAGRSVLTFAPTDLLLIVCAHGTKHHWQEIKWICDVAELVRTEKEKIDWIELQRRASQLGVRRMLSLGLILARDLLGADLPSQVSDSVKRDFGVGSIASTVVSKLFRGSEPDRDFEKVIFYLRTMDRWSDRARFCFSYLSQCMRAAVSPTSKEREFLTLPTRLSFLYYWFRPLRLAAKYLYLGLNRVIDRRATR